MKMKNNSTFKLKYDPSEWEISENSGVYRFIYLKTSEIYFLDGVIGINQVNSNSFLFFYKQEQRFKVTRIVINNGLKQIVYSHNFNKMDFLTDDLIIFDSQSVTKSILYSISKNCEIPFDIIAPTKSTIHDSQLCSERTIEMLTEPGKRFSDFLKIDFKLPAQAWNEYVQVIVEAKTLAPQSPVFSTLRNKYLPLEKDYSLKQIIEEDTKYLKEIEDFYCTSNKISSETLLTKVRKSS